MIKEYLLGVADRTVGMRLGRDMYKVELACRPKDKGLAVTAGAMKVAEQVALPAFTEVWYEVLDLVKTDTKTPFRRALGHPIVVIPGLLAALSMDLAANFAVLMIADKNPAAAVLAKTFANAGGHMLIDCIRNKVNNPNGPGRSTLAFI